MEEQVEIIRSNKGGLKVIHKGYMYTVHKKRQCGGIRWRCAQRSLHCRGSISTGKDHGYPKFNMPHNHLPDYNSVAMARGRKEEVDPLASEAPPAEDSAVFDKMTRKYIKYGIKQPEPVRKYEMRVRKPKPPDENDLDSMPLQERLSKTAPIEQPMTSQGLKSQSLSPTKLKVTRQLPKLASRPAPPVPTERSASPPNEEMCLRWNSHHSNMQTAFPNILSKEQYVDVTLAAEGKTLKCHRLILSSCSPYFEEVLSGISPLQHPVLFMRDIPFWILKSLCDFMYAGEVHICQNRLEELLAVAELLKIKGLARKVAAPPVVEKEQKKHETFSNIQKSHTATSSKPSGNNYQPIDYDNDDLDPLDLLEPLYEEVNEEKKQTTLVKPQPINKLVFPVQQKKVFPKRIKKRKYSEQRDPSPPPVFSFRKGTRSRPNVKIPKYYDTDYANPAKGNISTAIDPLIDIDEIKTEPIDVEDNLIDYSDEENHFVPPESPPTNHAVIITPTKPETNCDGFKRIQLSKPIITQVETVKDVVPPVGGLEVIKITLHQPNNENKADEELKITCEPVVDVPQDEETEQHVELEVGETGVQKESCEKVPDEEKQENETATDQTEINVTDGTQIGNNNSEETEIIKEIGNNSDNNIQDEELNNTEVVEPIVQTSLDHLEKEAMNVVNVINMETKPSSE